MLEGENNHNPNENKLVGKQDFLYEFNASHPDTGERQSVFEEALIETSDGYKEAWKEAVREKNPQENKLFGELLAVETIIDMFKKDEEREGKHLGGRDYKHWMDTKFKQPRYLYEEKAPSAEIVTDLLTEMFNKARKYKPELPGSAYDVSKDGGRDRKWQMLCTMMERIGNIKREGP